MSKDTTQLESTLDNLRAKPLDPDLLERLEACANESWTELTPMERHLEKELQHTKPAALNPDLLNSMLAATKDIPFEASPTIVEFPSAPVNSTKSARPWWSAAAAVALFGGAAAFLIPLDQQPVQTAGNTTSPSALPYATPAASTPTTASGAIVPAEFSRKISQATDEGIIWNSESQPHRVVKVIYHERVTMKRDDGSTYEVEQPRVEYYMLPENSD